MVESCAADDIMEDAAAAEEETTELAEETAADGTLRFTPAELQICWAKARAAVWSREPGAQDDPKSR